MSTKIEWCNEVWNPVTGCTKVSEGCRNCYAERMTARMAKMRPEKYGAGFGEVVVHHDELEKPLRWKKPRRIFVNSMSDLFHKDVPVEFIDQVIAGCALCPQHRFLILTKRPERLLQYFSSSDRRENIFMASFGFDLSPSTIGRPLPKNFPLPNVWLGVSVEDQATADARIPLLLQTPAAVRFVSYEPALGPVDFTWLGHDGDGVIDALRGEDWVEDWFDLEGKKRQRRVVNQRNRLDWIIMGGESGPGARPMHPDWARSVRDQCAKARVPFFFKQFGEWKEWDFDDWDPMDKKIKTHVFPISKIHSESLGVYRIGKKKTGRLLDGREHNEYPGSQ